MYFGSSSLAHYPTNWFTIEQEIQTHSFILFSVPASLLYLIVFLLNDSFGVDNITVIIKNSIIVLKFILITSIKCCILISPFLWSISEHISEKIVF